MMNPYLRDTIDRVTRDTDRKLGWSDRFVGTMRLALENGIDPRRYALGAAAALVTLDPPLLDGHGAVEAVLRPLWSDAPDDDQAIIGRITTGLDALRAWVGAGFDPRLLEIG
jgi:hypothetical protein